MNTPTLETNRLVLRRFTPQDLEALYQIYRDREVNRFLPWFPLENLQQAQVFYAQRYAAKYAQPQGYAYAICKKEDNFPIGYIKVDMDEAHDLGYGLRKEFWHKASLPRRPRPSSPRSSGMACLTLPPPMTGTTPAAAA